MVRSRFPGDADGVRAEAVDGRHRRCLGHHVQAGQRGDVRAGQVDAVGAAVGRHRGIRVVLPHPFQRGSQLGTRPISDVIPFAKTWPGRPWPPLTQSSAGHPSTNPDSIA